jgi:integrase
MRRGHLRRELEARPLEVVALDPYGVVQLDQAVIDRDGIYAVLGECPRTGRRPRTFSRSFDHHVRDADLPKIRLHDLRHTHATLALEAGVHPKVVQERLGHATIAITIDTYSHAIPAMQEDAAAKIAALLG